MIKEILEKNEDIKPNTIFIEKLKKDFPQCFDNNGNFDIEIFKDFIKNDDITIKNEGHSLNFLGKSYARYVSGLESETVIVPDENNANIDSENVYIVGDNLDALQHLRHSYTEKIKCIYIDPPYNTGSDGFIYNDKFNFTAKELADKLKIEEEEAQHIIDMNGGCTHSAWLTFMYPRLLLAYELLSDEGVIFISIDDNEMSNCKLLCDMVFGESNFLGQFTVNSTPNARDYGHIGKMHDYVLFYAKNYSMAETFLIEEKEKKFKYQDNIGGFNIHPLYNSNEAFTNINRPNLYYPFYLYLDEKNSIGENFYNIGFEKTNNSVEIYPPKSQKNDVQFVWRWGKEKSQKYMNSEILGYKTEDGEYRIVQKMRHNSKLIRSILSETDFSTRKGTAELEELFGEKNLFSFPKPVELIKRLISAGIDNDGIVLDFFSGSATTAQAVFNLNADRFVYKSKIKFILVQIDENFDALLEEELSKKKPKKDIIDKYNKAKNFLDSINKPHLLSQIGMERIRRSAKQLINIEPEKTKNMDLSFKTYYLKSTPKNVLDKLSKFEPSFSIDSGDIIKQYGLETILSTWKVKDGYGFNTETEEIKLIDNSIYMVKNDSVGPTLYILSEISNKDVLELIKKIENYEINIDRIIVYGYALGFNSLTMLKTNLKTIKNIKHSFEPIIRY